MEQNHYWHTKSTDQAFDKLISGESGLSQKEAEARLAKYGPNEIQAAHRVSPWEILLEQFKNVLILILLGATAISFFLGHGVESIVIAVIGFVMDFWGSWRRWAAGLLLVLCAACASGAIAEGDPEAAQMALQEYRLGPGDQLRIVVFGEERLSGAFVVSPSGSIAYPLVGEVPAQGKTVAEFSATLAEVLRGGYVRQPNVTVEVATYRPFFILGEVGAPGTYPFAAGLTVMNAVATAGGFSYRADTRRVFIKHPEEAGEREYRLTSTTPIRPGDTVVVAASGKSSRFTGNVELTALDVEAKAAGRE